MTQIVRYEGLRLSSPLPELGSGTNSKFSFTSFGVKVFDVSRVVVTSTPAPFVRDHIAELEDHVSSLVRCLREATPYTNSEETRALARQAVATMQARQGEDLDEWSRQLARDAAGFDD